MFVTIFDLLQLSFEFFRLESSLCDLLHKALLLIIVSLIKMNILAYRHDLFIFFLILCGCFCEGEFAYTVITLGRQFWSMILVVGQKRWVIELPGHLKQSLLILGDVGSEWIIFSLVFLEGKIEIMIVCMHPLLIIR